MDEVQGERLHLGGGDLTGPFLAVTAQVVLHLAAAEDDVAGDVPAAHPVLVAADQGAAEAGGVAEQDARGVPVQIAPRVPGVLLGGLGAALGIVRSGRWPPLMNLALCLMNTRRPLSKKELRESIEAYREAW
ncbi:hypothetical protein ABZ885_39365, partial [Kitasatospora sp. NPDC047058]